MQLATLAETKMILEKNFHGPDETNLFFNCDLALDGSWLVPWTTKTLHQHRKECVFVVGCDIDHDDCPITINEMRRRWPQYFQNDLSQQYVNDPWRTATTPVRARSYLLHKRIPDLRNNTNHIIKLHPSRKSKTIPHKLAQLKPQEQLETAAVHVFAALLHYLTTKELPYPYDYILCADTARDGRHARIGYFADRKMYVGCAWQELTIYLGLAPGIRPDIEF